MAAPRGKSRDFITFQESPYNGGPQLGALCRTHVTPSSLHFVRSHGEVPRIDPESYGLKVEGLVKRPRSFSLGALRRMRKRRASVAIECAGNRRAELNAVEPVFGEIPWGPQAIGNAEWGGVPLSAVLEDVGPRRGASHVAFTGLDTAIKDGAPTPFGGSIPLLDAVEGGVLLAYEMNRKPLPPEHGGPLRAVVPGYIGARSVKWLGTIEVRDSSSPNPFQSLTYKIVARGATRADWQSAPPLGRVRLNCAITEPTDGSRVPARGFTVSGYARASAGWGLKRVQLSLDGGSTWLPVDEVRGFKDAAEGGWVTWSAPVRLASGANVLVARCSDRSSSSQPSSLARAWNAGGYVNNAWHRVRVHVVP